VDSFIPWPLFVGKKADAVDGFASGRFLAMLGVAANLERRWIKERTARRRDDAKARDV
jgi:DNA invertase Pin-like site-specific DNA recombinase